MLNESARAGKATNITKLRAAAKIIGRIKALLKAQKWSSGPPTKNSFARASLPSLSTKTVRARSNPTTNVTNDAHTKSNRSQVTSSPAFLYPQYPNISSHGLNPTANTRHHQYVEGPTLPTLILTLQLDAPTQTVYENLRHQHFPPERNLIAAHLTLFHQLPDEPLTHELIRQAATATQPFHLTNPTPRSLGRGVAVFFQSPPLTALHAAISTTFAPHLIPQPRQRLQPHIVIQNKVTPDLARQTLPHLQSISLPEPQALGLTLHRYLNGPWHHLTDFPFPPKPSP